MTTPHAHLREKTRPAKQCETAAVARYPGHIALKQISDWAEAIATKSNLPSRQYILAALPVPVTRRLDGAWFGKEFRNG